MFRAADNAGNQFQSGSHLVWVNRAPIAKIMSPGNGTELTSGENLTLDGSGSMDPDDDNLTFEWFIKDNFDSISRDVISNVTLEVGTHILVLTVTDVDGAIGSSEVTVIVHEPVEPTTESMVDQNIIIIVLILILIILASLLYVRRRAAG